MTKTQNNKKYPFKTHKKKSLQILKTLLLSIPIITSLILLYSSPNLFHEAQTLNSQKKINTQKKQNIQKIFSKLKNTYPIPHTPYTPPQKPSPQKPSPQTPSLQTPSLQTSQTQNTFSLYFPKMIQNKIHLSSLQIPKPPQTQDPIPFVLNHLFQINPAQYQIDSKNLIPKNTKLINYQLSQGLLTLNLNDSFLNHSYGEIGKKLKIAQIVATMTSLNHIQKITFQIHGKYTPFLDRDGSISNQAFTNSYFQWPILLE